MQHVSSFELKIRKHGLENVRRQLTSCSLAGPARTHPVISARRELVLIIRHGEMLRRTTRCFSCRSKSICVPRVILKPLSFWLPVSWRVRVSEAVRAIINRRIWQETPNEAQCFPLNLEIFSISPPPKKIPKPPLTVTMDESNIFFVAARDLRAC